MATHDVIYWPVSEESYVFCLLFWYCCDYGSIFLRQYVLFNDNADTKCKITHRGFNKAEQWTTLGWKNLLLLSHKQQSTFQCDSAKNYFWQGKVLNDRNDIYIPATKMDLKLLLVDLSLSERLRWDFRRIFSCCTHAGLNAGLLSLPHQCLFIGVKRGFC